LVRIRFGEHEPGKEEAMDEGMVRIVAGVLAVVLVGVIMWRRNRQASE
jgi:hypothetical protein